MSNAHTSAQPDPVSAEFLGYSAERLRTLQKTIADCCDRLSDEQMLWRAGEYDNSIVNLLLHLAGNMRQWVLHGLRGDADVRRRDDEFALSLETTPADARRLSSATIEEAAQVIVTFDPERLLEVVDPQPTGTWRHTPILVAIYKVVGHVDHHAGQIIMATKRLTSGDLDLTMPRKR